MIHIRQPFFSIATASIFAILGLLYGAAATKGVDVTLGTANIGPEMTWGLVGLLFLMAYFALVHLKD